MVMSLQEIHEHWIVKEVLKCAEEYPDNVYTTSENSDGKCLYTDGTNSDCPYQGCLIGFAFSRLGLRTQLLACDVLSETHYISVDIEGLLDRIDILSHHELDVPDAVKAWLTYVQENQDFSAQWSVCVKDADDCMLDRYLSS